MSPTPKHTTARRITRATLLLALGGALAFVAMPVSAVSDTPVCHATGSESNPYVYIVTSASGAYHGHMGNSPQHQLDEDIIPPFTYKDVVYSQNWDAEGQAIFADCDEEGTTTETHTETSGSETGTETSSTETTTEPEVPEEEVPFFGAPLTIGLGLVGAAGGAMLMLRRRL